MGRRAKYNKEFKLEIVRRYIAGESASELAREYQLKGANGRKRVLEWRNKYENSNESAFDPSNRNKAYRKELKQAAIQEYLEGEGS